MDILKNKFVLGGLAAAVVYVAMRWKKQGFAWTVPGSQQDKMLQAQAFDATYSTAYTEFPGQGLIRV